MKPEVSFGLEVAGTEGKPVLLLVHGFAGSSHTWDAVLPLLEPHFQLVLLDLPGHGTAAFQPDISLLELCEAVSKILVHGIPEPRFVCGYSMGGRIALHVALHWPNAMNKLAVIGASPGIESIEERAARHQSDQALAAQIRANGIEWFENYWSNLPLFATQKELPPEVQDWLKRERLGNRPEGLAVALENWGTGMQEWLLPRLAEIHCPTLLISGARDEKFCNLSRQIAEVIPASRHVEIPASGHAAHIEQPEAVAHELISFFQ